MQRVKVEVELTRSALATAMLNSKTTAQAASGCGILHSNFCAQAFSLRHQITWKATRKWPIESGYKGESETQKAAE